MKKWIMKSIIVGICLFIPVHDFTGCSGEKDVLAFSDEIGFSRADGTDLAAEINAVDGGYMFAESEKEGVLAENLRDQEAVSEKNKPAPEEEIVVYLCGAVKNPGVYTLKAGSRINDAVEAAGGFLEDAAEAAVNLAAKLADADMIYIPTKEEAELEYSLNISTDGSAQDSLVNINTADLNTLCSLPGIGESRARDIIIYREKNGDFQKTEDIMRVSGIKTSLYEKISDMISVR